MPGEKNWNELPAVTRLDSLHQTDFVPTLENPVDPRRNTIYASALLYAWDTIVKLLPDAIVDDTIYSNDFNLLRKSVAHKNSLLRDEYRISAGIEDRLIVAEAYFNKTLPFPAKMEKAVESMLFNGQKVKAFGMYGINEDIAAFCDILYYENDDRFILKLLPQENEHEIWLVKCPDVFASLADAVQKTKEWKNKGEKERYSELRAWKYSFGEKDSFSIPEIKFNIDFFYKELEGPIFLANGEERRFVTAYQRTGFILNESGAVAESHAVAVTDSAGPVVEDQPRLKKLEFNKPFYVILKRTGSQHPYFVMRVANRELLVKQ